MKSQWIILILSTALILSCRKDKTDLTYKECYSEITPTSEAYFYKDAKQFGIQRLEADTLSEYALNPVYREEETVYVLGKLSAIYNAATYSQPGTPLHDIIFKYQIHKLEGSSLTILALEVVDWSVQLDFTKNFGSTQNDELNMIAAEFDFTSSYTWFGNKDIVLLKTEQNYILTHFGRRLEGTPGITGIFPSNHYLYNVNINAFDITYSWTDEYDEFIFTYGFGDCIMGCDLHRHWKVRVDHDCNVTFIEDYGDALPG
ncbi:MAG: hypothetical protein HYZ14_15410 [Bacteroidetes bacterium]|nr:hypothetical protein [Bacteroidota bacterium]